MKKFLSVLLACMLIISFSCSVFAEQTGTVTYQPNDIHLDLSGMSGTVVYSMIYNILYDPGQYIGKVIRLAGYYSVWQDPGTGSIYHSCVIPDATACCAQGFEFVWGGDHLYPDDYPEMGTDMIVTGTLESYMEGEYMYLHLVDSDVSWLTEE